MLFSFIKKVPFVPRFSDFCTPLFFMFLVIADFIEDVDL